MQGCSPMGAWRHHWCWGAASWARAGQGHPKRRPTWWEPQALGYHGHQKRAEPSGAKQTQSAYKVFAPGVQAACAKSVYHAKRCLTAFPAVSIQRCKIMHRDL